jgi:hypothetical protein
MASYGDDVLRNGVDICLKRTFIDASSHGDTLTGTMSPYGDDMLRNGVDVAETGLRPAQLKKVPRGQWVKNKKTNPSLRAEAILTMRDRSSKIWILMKNDLFFGRGELGGVKKQLFSGIIRTILI